MPVPRQLCLLCPIYTCESSKTNCGLCLSRKSLHLTCFLSLACLSLWVPHSSSQPFNSFTVLDCLCRVENFAFPSINPIQYSCPKSLGQSDPFRVIFYDNISISKQCYWYFSRRPYVLSSLSPFNVIPESHGLQNLRTRFPRSLARGFPLTLCQREYLKQDGKVEEELAETLSL